MLIRYFGADVQPSASNSKGSAARSVLEVRTPAGGRHANGLSCLRIARHQKTPGKAGGQAIAASSGMAMKAQATIQFMPCDDTRLPQARPAMIVSSLPDTNAASPAMALASRRGAYTSRAVHLPQHVPSPIYS